MSGEIYMSRLSTDTLYALVWRQSDSYLYDVAADAFAEVTAWGTTPAIGDCDIPLVAAGDLQFADFPAVDAGLYVVQVRLQAGANPAVGDFIIGQGFMEWSDTAGDDGGSGEITITDVVTASSMVNNVFLPEPEEDTSRIYI